MSLGKVGADRRVSFGLRRGNGAPATGVTLANVSVIIRNDNNANTNDASASVVEDGLGDYFFVVPNAFTTANAAGRYYGNVTINDTAPVLRDVIPFEVQFFDVDLDDLAIPGSAMDLVTDAVDADAVATTGADEIAVRFLLAALASGDSVDDALSRLDNVDVSVTTTIPANIATAESNIRGGDSRDLTNLAGAGWVAADNLVQAHNKLDLIQADIDNFENITRFKLSLPTFEIPEAGTELYEFFFNLKDDQGLPVNADGVGGGTVSLEATAHGGIAGDRDGRLGATTMTNLATGEYVQTFSVAAADIIEGIRLRVSWAEGGNANNVTKSFTVIDSAIVGYLASDRTRDDQIATETTAILVDTDVTIPGLITSLNDIDIADVQTAMTNQGYTTARAPFLDELDAANLPADVDTLLSRLTAGRALNLDEITAVRLAELDAANLPADVDTLLTRLSASRAANLDEITAARLAELDPANMPADLDTLIAAMITATGTVAAGSTSTVINSTISAPDDRFNNMQVIVTDGTRFIARNVNDYANASGAFTVDDLGFTPGTGVVIRVLARTGSVPLDIASFWAFDLDANFAEGGDLEQAGGVLHFLRQMATNISAEVAGNPGSYTLRNDADDGDVGSYTLRDSSGNATASVAGAPAQRGAFTP